MIFVYLQLIVSIPATAQNSSYNANTIPITGSYSTAFGISALLINTGSGNTSTGYPALYSNNSGVSKTATGRAAMYATTTGAGNSACGYYSLFANTT